MDMIYLDTDSGYTIRLADAVISLLRANRQRGRFAREKGGLLFAKSNQSAELLVSEASPPNKRDRSRRHALTLDPVRTKSEIENANARGLWFVGYWHTHPQPIPSISLDDIRAFSNNLRCDRIGIKALLAVIVGNQHDNQPFTTYLVTTDSVRELTPQDAGCGTGL